VSVVKPLFISALLFGVTLSLGTALVTILEGRCEDEFSRATRSVKEVNDPFDAWSGGPLEPKCGRTELFDDSVDPRCYHLQEALVSSSINGDLNGIRSGLRDGANIQGGYFEYYPPLISATMSGQRDAVKLLLDRGADINTQENFGMTPLTEAVFYDRPDIVKLLLERGANVCTWYDPHDLSLLQMAKKNQDTEIEHMLLEAGADKCE